MRKEREGARIVPARLCGAGPRVGAQDVGAGEQCPAGADPCVDARKRTAIVGVQALAVPF